MKIGLIGSGHWGSIYRKTFADLGIPLEWVTSRDLRFDADAVVIATPAETHYEIAKVAISHGCHVLIEKPMTMDVAQATALVELARRMEVVGFVGHVHLYSPAWREIKKHVTSVTSVSSISGGPCKTIPLLDWGSHDVSMRLDLGAKDVPHDMNITTHRVKRRFQIVTPENIFVYDDPPTNPTPMEVLVSEFVAACELGKPDIEGMVLGRDVMEILCA
jgi:hypothetical protein